MQKVCRIWWFRPRAYRQVAAALGLGLLGCSEQPSSAPPAAPPPTVTTIAVTSRPFAASFEFLGETQAWRKAEIRARVTGFLTEQSFEEGRGVEPDQVLFTIDPAEFDAAKASAAASLQRAEATLKEARQTLERSSELAERGTISQATLDDAVAAEARALADVDAAEAELRRVDLNLGYTKIRSPIRGRAGKSSVDVGNLIGPDSGSLATVVTLDPMRVVFSLSERVFLEVNEAQRSGESEAIVPRIRLANDTVYPHEGQFEFVDNQVDQATGTIRVFVTFPNPDASLLPGLFVTVILSSEKPREQILVPQAAVQLNQSGPFVLVVDGDQRVELRQVTTGEQSGTDIVITDGIQTGETIIIEGIQKVRPGGTVTAVAGAPAAVAN